METLSRMRGSAYIADIVAFNSDDVPVMLVEVKARQEEKVFDKEQLVQYLQAAPAIPYAMLVTLRDIQIFEWKSQTPSSLLTVPTADILSVYDKEFSKKNTYHDYLTTLTEAWLRDVAYHWKSTTPPLFDQLTQLDLSGKLNNGTTRQEQTIERDFVSWKPGLSLRTSESGGMLFVRHWISK